MLKEIGTAARKEIEEILGVKVFLELRVKVAAGLARGSAAGAAARLAASRWSISAEE